MRASDRLARGSCVRRWRALSRRWWRLRRNPICNRVIGKWELEACVPATFETLRVLKEAEEIADSIWKRVVRWDEFAKDVVGKQIARAADSIGANIAESFGRFHFGEKLQFLYFARGSLFETKYWLNRALARELMSAAEAQEFVARLTSLARQLNAFADSLRTVRSDSKSPKTLREMAAQYRTNVPDDFPNVLFDDQDLAWLQS
ncbi:MAG: four helix bundle protein [Chloroflexota bacterium]|nr:four helix bundle protein [Chloroflexota bacterium]